jgi:hypothetical protein
LGFYRLSLRDSEVSTRATVFSEKDMGKAQSSRALFGQSTLNDCQIHSRLSMLVSLKSFQALPFFGITLLLLGAILSAQGATLELANAVILSPPGLSATELKAVQMLREEVEKRSQILWPEREAWPTNHYVIAIGPRASLAKFSGPYAGKLKDSATVPHEAEGYRVCVQKRPNQTAIFIIGNDARGVLFGVGRLLRELRMIRGSVKLEDDLEIVTNPKYPLRGHQLGYRPKCNSYDAWDLRTWEQYIRDLAVFGCNSIELIPPRSDDEPDSPHFPKPPMEMMVGMSQLANDYGLDVWVWYPAMDADYSNPVTVEAALKEWAEVFRKLPRIDAIFVPGGDPGHTRPKYLMALLEKQTRNLHHFHPKAQMWVSPQSFNQEWLDEFIALLKQEHPAWLSGVVFGPQVRVSLPALRALVPRQYPIRHYPDITHSRQCQYPVPDWDVAYAVTEARECINPRPEDEASIFLKLQPDTVGFITYSEGCNDDLNKFVWSALGWDPSTTPLDCLRQYSKYFISETNSEQFAQGLVALERDWRGSLATNDNVEATLARFQALERSASPFELRNWRFQQALFRAYYDAYVRRRLIYESGLEEQAITALEQAPTLGAANAMTSALAILAKASTNRVAADLRARIFELGEALFQSIGMQLSVAKYKAIAVDRGACLDTVDYPLNNRLWLQERFNAIKSLAAESERLQALKEIVHWTDPGPGGFYDDLGNPARQPHLVRDFNFRQDPGAMQSVRSDFEEDLVADEPDEKTEGARRLSWVDHAETLYETPLQLRYTQLDPQGRYKLRVVYAGDNPKRKIRLAANENVEIHPFINKPIPFRPLEFPIPPEATRDGNLNLKWFGEPGLGGNGRGCQVSEVWLLKEAVSSNP